MSAARKLSRPLQSHKDLPFFGHDLDRGIHFLSLVLASMLHY